MKFSQIKTGEILSTTMYLEVLSKNEKEGSIEVKDSFGRTFTVKGKDLIEQTMISASQFEQEEKVSRTKAIEALLSAGDAVLTADYVKQDGTPRTMIGRLLGTENFMGRSSVFDFEEKDKAKSPIKQVDHRTLKSVILKGTKYTVKK